ncbi:phage tail tape measure protein [Thalassospira profundimaris]|uniref:phage tail tape measure protein n=1 Tax=Thalassospira profundimaris TaxID=502049 RepID=UPI000DEE1A30|nr:phage tail tape measure protein [Thalassospira profundimaris]
MADLKLNILMQAADKVTAPFRRMRQSTDQLRNQLGEAASRVRDLERVSGNIQSFRDLKAAARQNATALAAAENRAQQLGQQIASTDRVTRKMRAEFNAARKEVARLRQAETTTSAATAEMRERLRSAGIDTRRLSSAQRQLRGDLDAARRAAEQQSQALEQARRRTNQLAAARSRMQRTMQLQANMAMGGAAGMAVGGGALALGSRMAGAGIDFGEQMSAVGAIARLDQTSEAMAALRQQAKELGATTSFSASEAASGMQFLAMAGFDANEVLQTMPGMLDLAKAGATDLATTADIASNVLSGFGMKASEMGRLGDIMTATFTRSNVDLTMLGETMKYTAPIAKEFGASVEDVAAMSGMLGNVGIQGSMAGTALRSLFSRMSKPPTEAAAAMKELGVSTMDANGNARDMVAILADVAKSTEGMGSAQRLAQLTAIAGQEAGAAFATLIDQGGSGAITQFIDILNNSMGETTRVAKQMGDNAAGDIKSFWSAVEGMNIALTDTNDAPLRSLIQSATGVVRSVTSWVQENPVLASTLVKVAAGVAGLIFVGGILATTVAGLLGPFAMARFAMTALGIQSGLLGGGFGIVSKGIGLVASVAKVAFPIVTGGLRAMAVAAMANPLIAIIGGIAIAATLIFTYWEPIKTFFVNLWDSITSKFSGTWETIKTLLSFTPIGLIATNWGAIMDFFINLWDSVLGGAKAAFDWIGEKIGWISELFGDGKKTIEVKGTGPQAPKNVRNMRTNPVRTMAVAPVAAAIATGPAGASAQTTPVPTSQDSYQIIINPPAGSDEKAIAAEVRRQIEEFERRKQARARTAMIDRTN